MTKPLSSSKGSRWNDSLSSLATFGKDVEAFKGTKRVLIEARLAKGLDCLGIVVLGFVAFACFSVKSFPFKEPSSIFKLMRKELRLLKIPGLT